MFVKTEQGMRPVILSSWDLNSLLSLSGEFGSHPIGSRSHRKVLSKEAWGGQICILNLFCSTDWSLNSGLLLRSCWRRPSENMNREFDIQFHLGVGSRDKLETLEKAGTSDCDDWLDLGSKEEQGVWDSWFSMTYKISICSEDKF